MRHILQQHCFIKLVCTIPYLNRMHPALMLAHLISMQRQEILPVLACLYYNDGVWNGERILPEGWVKQTVTPPAANKLKNYGYQFWLNGLNKKDPSKRKYPDVPADMFYCDGYAGQAIYIIPSKKLVIVRLGLNPRQII